MPLVTTQAIVLHAFDYLETSRVLRLITRDAGVLSVIAKGARRTRGRVGTGVDLFAEGEVEIYIKPNRDLHTLGAFDVTSSRAGLALELSRFTAASALAELTLRIAGDEVNEAIYDSLARTLDSLARAPDAEAAQCALRGAWRIIGEAGFSPALDQCAACHAVLAEAAAVAFSHPAGGALCGACARHAPATRTLPASALRILRSWQDGDDVASDDPDAAVPQSWLTSADVRAHQRLLREFVREHVTSDDRPLRAFAAWESEPDAAPAASAIPGRP